MAIYITRIQDLDLARDMHRLAFPSDAWVGDDHTFWVAHDGRKLRLHSGIHGFASAIIREHHEYVFLSRCAIVKVSQGRGLQRRLIEARCAWGRTQGVRAAITYTTLKNYASMVNLIRCGFSFYTPTIKYTGDDVHYFKRVLTE